MPTIHPDTGLPVVVPEDQEALRHFWTEYELDYDVVHAELQEQALSMPGISELMARIPRAEQEAQQRLSRRLLREALHDGHWENYVQNARTQGAVYAQMGLEFSVWFDLTSAFQRLLMPRVAARHATDTDRLCQIYIASSLFVNIVLGLIGSEYLRTKDELSRRQQRAILELSTPVLQVRERMLILPIIGVIDSNRARQLTESLLYAIRVNRAKVVVMDITGVPAVDSKVANHLVQTVEAGRLMGAAVVVTGLSADVAQALVTLGLDLSKLHTVGDLQGGIEEAERLLGYRVTQVDREERGPL